LWGIKLSENTEIEQTNAAKDIVQKYNQDIDRTEFLKEIVYLKSAVSPFLKHGQKLVDTTPIDILNIITLNGLTQQFVNSHTAIRIFLTLPVTVASNERSFSKLKIIKNHLRSSMGQERLSDLSILSIESEYVKSLSFETIINDFATAKCRKVAL
jgi:hypothetical protein